MKPLSDFYPRIQPYISGVPIPTMDAAIIDAAVKFCQDTKAIHARTDPFTTEYGQATYDLDAPSEQRVSSIRAVWINGRKITSLLDGQVPGPADAMGAPTHYYGSRDGDAYVVGFYPTPSDPCTVVADVAYAPLRSAKTLDADLLELWIEAIRAGTLAALYGIPGQPFSDMAMASAAGSAFLTYTAKAKRASVFNRVEGSQSVDPRPLL